jgi:acyl carrier protein
MVRNWISAAAAAGSLSAGMLSGVAPSPAPHQVEAPTSGVPRSERARIVGIGAEVRRIVGHCVETDPRAIVAPSALRELGLDEIALADVVLGLETRFGIGIEDAEAARWVTVADVVGFVARHAPRAATS